MRQDIQGLRAIAVLLVVIYHAGGGLHGGYTGVDVFFVISGFVITQLLERQRALGAQVSLGSFYARRARRLLPAAGLTVLSVMVLSALLQSPLGAQQTTAKTGVAAAGLAANLQLLRQHDAYFDSQSGNNPLLHMWSLGVEEQFYLVFPGLLVLLWAANRRRSRFVVPGALGVVVGLSVAATFVLSTAHANLAFYSPVTRAWEFASGALLASVLPLVKPLRAGVAATAGALGLVAIGAGAVGTTVLPAGHLVLPVVGALLVIAAGSGTPWADRSPLTIRPLVWLGDRSYSWYLWHWPLIVFAGLLLPDHVWAPRAAAVLALLPAALSFQLVEQPLRRARRVQGRRLIALGLASTAVPMMAAVGLYAGAQQRWGTPLFDTMNAAQAPLHDDINHGCDSRLHPGPPGARCVFGAGLRGTPVYLVGDSNAGQFTEPLALAANRSGHPLTVSTRSTCPFVDAELFYFGGRRDDCRSYVRETIQRLRAQRHGLVVIATATDIINRDYVAVGDPRTGSPTTDLQRKQQLWTDELTRTLEAVKSAGHEVLVVHVIPHFFGWQPAACSVARAVADSCGTSLSLSELSRIQGPAYAIETTAARRAGVATFDLRADLCPQGECRTNTGSQWVYRDATHLTVSASQALSGRFGSVLRRLLLEEVPASAPVTAVPTAVTTPSSTRSGKPTVVTPPTASPVPCTTAVPQAVAGLHGSLPDPASGSPAGCPTTAAPAVTSPPTPGLPGSGGLPDAHATPGLGDPAPLS